MTDDAIDILLVEDNPNDVELTLYAFESSDVTCRIEVARDGADALDFLFASGQYAGRDQSHLPRLILLDLKVPRVGGLEMLKRIRSDRRTRMLPVVVLTSSSEARDVTTCYELGANSYIVKPVNFDDFTGMVRTIKEYWLNINLPIPGLGTSAAEPAAS